MAQHDYVIANGSGSAVRGDLNNALAAIVSNNSGSSEPSPTYAYQFWADTTTGLLKIRNAANNAWITLRELDGTLSIEAGTVSAPGLYFTGDPNTGLYSPAADQFAIATNGVERVEWGTSEVVFNDGGADYDFRVEGATKPNLFKVDAGTDTVIIDGITYPSADGTADQALVTTGSGVLSFASRSRLVSGTAVASTSGTSIDFTGIPSWVKRVTVMFSGVSTNGTSPPQIQIGTSSGFVTTGYLGSNGIIAGQAATANFTTGFGIGVNTANWVAAWAAHGHIGILLLGSNTWAASGTVGASGGAAVYHTTGSVTLPGTLDRIRITTVNGTDTFDAGSINIMYEG